MLDMEKQIVEMFAKASFFFVVGVILASLFMWSMMQGITAHIAGHDAMALPYYFVGWVSGVGGLALYWQAKYIFHVARVSG